jgi:hypothetical protein
MGEHVFKRKYSRPNQGINPALTLKEQHKFCILGLNVIFLRVGWGGGGGLHLLSIYKSFCVSYRSFSL